MARTFGLGSPAAVSVTEENGTVSALGAAGEEWSASGITVRIHETSGRVTLDAPHTLIRCLHLRWRGGMPEGSRFLGDHWERGYGDLEWRGTVPERRMPWYYFVQQNGTVAGWGVQTGASAFCWWQTDEEGTSLFLDVSSGGSGVRLGDRTLEVATLCLGFSDASETPFEFTRAFCCLLCPAPRLPDHPVYGINDWYFAYGSSTAATILRDTDRLASLAPESENRPYSVIDDGWQANRRDAEGRMQQRGPWDRGNADFPDMPGLAAAIRARGARPGIWIRPLTAPPGTPKNLLLPSFASDANGGVPVLDPSLPENRAQIREDFVRLRGWGYDLIKHDWTTCDLLGRWGFEMSEGVTRDGWHFADRSRTTAEIIKDLYQTIREGAGDAVVIGCNTVGHLGAGLFEIQRTGDDTSGREWERTRKMGINTLAFRMPQHETFFAADADCVGLTNQVPWVLNRQWLDLLARSGTPLFVSAAPEAVGPEQAAALKEAFARAALPQPAAEPVDWLHTTCPRKWKFGEEVVTYHWHEE